MSFCLFQADSMVSLSDSSSYLAEKLEENEAKVKFKVSATKNPTMWFSALLLIIIHMKIVANLILDITVQPHSTIVCMLFFSNFRPEN